MRFPVDLFGLALAGGLLCSCTSVGPGELPMSDHREQFLAVPALMRDGLVPGLQLAIIRNGRVVDVQSHGLADAASARAVDDRTVFEAASLGKPVFAYGVLRLASAGRLDLDSPIGRTLPDLSPALAALTPRHLLSHTAGLPNQGGGNDLRPEGLPGERFSYSGEGYRLLQRVVERVTGKPLNDYMQEEVFRPLGMTSSSYVWRDDYRDSKAFGHSHTGASAGRSRISDARAPSSLETTAADYARFMIASVRGTGLDPALARQFLSRQVGVEAGCVGCLDRAAGPPEPGMSWGLGWGLSETPGRRFAWHLGRQPDHAGLCRHRAGRKPRHGGFDQQREWARNPAGACRARSRQRGSGL